MTPRAVVLDTNILVSALWSPLGAPAKVVDLMSAGRIVPRYDERIMAEYRRVLHGDKFRDRFSHGDADALIAEFRRCAKLADVPPLPFVSFERDESDRPFYEIAVHCDALLITGNLKHYPDDPRVMKPDVFLERLAGATVP